MLKAVLFDFDGTVGDTLALCIEAFRQAIEPLVGRSFTDDEITHAFGPCEEGTSRLLVPDHPDEALAGYIREYAARHAMCPHPFPGILEILQSLRTEGKIVAMVTGKGKPTCDISLDYYGIRDLFDCVETGSPLGPSKPAGIRRVLERFHLSPDEAVYIGDVPNDITASREAGVRVISAAWASTANVEKLASENPDALCLTVASLRQTLTEWDAIL